MKHEHTKTTTTDNHAATNSSDLPILQTELDFGEADAIEEAAEVSPANTNDDCLDHDVLKAASSQNLFNDQDSNLIGSRHVLLQGRPYNCVVTPWFEEFRTRSSCLPWQRRSLWGILPRRIRESDASYDTH